jgi:hypothetical protein
VLALLSAMPWQGAFAQVVAPASLFQLDGNAAADNPADNTCAYGGVPGQICDYWDLLNGTGISPSGVGAGSSPGHSVVRTFIDGTTNTNNFSGGGSKDPSPISQWKYTSTSTPNKDTLNGAYAAAYTQDGDFEVIFGADRLSPNGDANIGIWFFQQDVHPVPGSTHFSGAHQDDDIFVISAFTGGGGTSTISVYAWDHTCASGVRNPQPGDCADANLRLLASPTTVCGNTAYCAVTNSQSTNITWEGGTSLISPLFFEGGVDITAALRAVGMAPPCFASFLVETRSSQSTTAVLKDFLSGGFPVCGLKLTKTCGPGTPDPSGTFVDFTEGGSVTNTGAAPLFNLQVSDVVTYADNTTQTLTLPVTVCDAPNQNGCGASPCHCSTTHPLLGPGDPDYQAGTWTTDVSSKPNTTSLSNQATVSGTAGADGGEPVTSTPSNLVSCSFTAPTVLQITKSCGVGLPDGGMIDGTVLVTGNNDVHVQVNFSGTVCNPGSSLITNLSLTDYTMGGATMAVTPSATTLQPCNAGDGGVCSAASCTTFSGSYTPTTIDATALLGRYFFNDEITISGAQADISTLDAGTTCNAVGENATHQLGCSGLVSNGPGHPNTGCPICNTGQCVQ